MFGDLLQTKLYILPLRPNLISRPRLIERINQGLRFGHKLTLISAPAGFGKTTLVTEWVAGCERPVAWLSLDEGDNDPTRFLIYIVAALQTLVPDIGERALALLQSPQPPPANSILTPLLNEISTIPDSFVLVLDDYHLIDTQPVDNVLTFLLEHLPPQMHLVIATREDPNLPLARLRAGGQLTELRVKDLRFGPSEAAQFLNRAMSLNLSKKEITALENRTEGWIAGLQLAAISMQGRAESATFIQAFTGSHRFVLDYLVEEVLQSQPAHVRSFLLQTSILDRLSGSLCDAVTAQEDGRGMLEALEHGNLFVVPLDDQRHWYRYHHLFADVLQAHAMEEQANLLPTLHQRASAWYEHNDSPSSAVRHALAADDKERTARLVELAWQAMDNSFQSITWLGWVQALPEELIRARPVLSTQYAFTLGMAGELEASESYLRDAEQWLVPLGEMSARRQGSADEMVVVDKEQFQTLPARIAIARAQNTLAQGDFSDTVKQAELALKLIPEEDPLRSQAMVLLGFTQWASGDLEAAYLSFADWVNSMRKEGNIVFVIASTFVLADIRVAQGRLREAVRIYKNALQLAHEQEEHVQRIIAHQYLGLTMLYHEMGDQDPFAKHMLKSRELGKQSVLPDWPYRWHVAQAQLKESAGELEAALNLLDEAERLYVRNQVPNSRPIEALKARVSIRQGNLAKALEWVHEQGLSVDDELSFLREFEHVMLTRVLIAEYRSDGNKRSIQQAIGLLRRLLKAADEGGRMGSVSEILLLQALAQQAEGIIPLALAALERALALAEPEGYFQLFVDEGPPLAAMLRDVAQQGISPRYVGRLRGAIGKSKGGRPAAQLLVDPLSDRELDVLRLLGTELSGPEIARKLMVSLNTMRTHTKNIYSKLDVNNRRTAVHRAEELDLI